MSDYSFANLMKNMASQEKTMTENGALAYRTSGSALLDFHFGLTALRNLYECSIQKKFAEVFFENPHIASKYLFMLRDCRGGAGERRSFRVCLKYLAENRPDIVRVVLPLVPEYGRWDDLWCLLDTSLGVDVIDMVGRQLDADNEAYKSNKPMSLLCKWMPSANASSRETKRLANIFISAWHITPAKYRKTLSRMRKKLDIVERKMSANQWGEISYSAVPSRANVLYKDAFLKHDHDRRVEFLESLKKNETKINASVLQPHEIIAGYNSNIGVWRSHCSDYDETLEQLWKALPDVTIGNTIVVADSSGSMTGGYGTKVRPIDVAMALAIYMSEHNSAEWKDIIISFSERPKILNFSNCESLHDKINYFISTSEVANTDIEKTMMLILNTAVKNHCPKEEMPKTVLILSDMQFDSARSDPRATSYVLFERIAERFKQQGYVMPKIVFWNLSGQLNNTIPMQENDEGLVLCSGFSVHLMKMVMSGKTDPYEVLIDMINDSRYDAVETALSGVV